MRNNQVKTVLLVFVHPEEKSYCGQVRDALQKSFLSQGANVLVSNLYQDDFQPIDKASEFQNRANPDYLDIVSEQKYSFHNGTMSLSVKAEQDKVLKADEIIFIAPLLWQNIPAMLQGWLERVLSAGFAYDFDKKFGKAPLGGKSAQLIITTGGTIGQASKELAEKELARSLSPLKDRPFAYCGIDLKQILPIVKPASFKEPEKRQKEIETIVTKVLAEKGISSKRQHRKYKGHKP